MTIYFYYCNHGLSFFHLLQQQWEISRRYAMFATPIAYLIDEQGVIVHNVAVGTDAILDLLAAQNWPDERAQPGIEYVQQNEIEGKQGRS